MTSAGHITIADVCAAAVPRLRPFAAALREGSVAPDHMMDHRGRRHHDLRVGITKRKYLAVLARAGLQLGGGAGAAFRLGMLLHYIADGAVAVAGDDPSHASYEAAVTQALRRLHPAAPPGVGGWRDVLYPEDAAPRADLLGRYTVPDPATAAERALTVSLQVARAVFAPARHPRDVALTQRLAPRARPLGAIAAIAAALGLWLARGLWFWPALTRG
jgi:hypothetical protein